MFIRIVISIISGFLLVFSFPKADLWVLAWFALCPLFFVMLKSRPLQALFYGFVFGATFFSSLVYWIFNLLRIETGLCWPLCFLVFLLLVVYLSLFPSLVGYLASQAAGQYGSKAVFFIPMIWVSLELVRNYLFTGFSWGIVGYTQSSFLSLIQLASVSGVYGISFLVIFCNASVVYLFLERRGFKAWIPVLVLVLVIGMASGWGYSRLFQEEREGGKVISVACIQGNYGSQIGTEASQTAIFRNYRDLTLQAAALGCQLVVWPESTTHYQICCTEGYADLLAQLCRENGIDMVLGSVHQRRDSSQEKHFNSAFHIDASGKVAERYDKIHLVPYGEYVPIPGILFFVKRFVQAAGDFSKGSEYIMMNFRGDPFSTLICYEVIFPESVRAFARRGATFFINITNDSWFGRSAAPYQHFQFSIFRAIESERYFIRCASTGISGIISPQGKILAQTEIFSRELLQADIRPIHESTLYCRTGDWLAIGCVIITLALIISLLFRWFQSRKYRKGVADIEIGDARTI
jgi:apolipoprotein N-acyltransferase